MQIGFTLSEIQKVITNIACVGIENAKILAQAASGEPPLCYGFSLLALL